MSILLQLSREKEVPFLRQECLKKCRVQSQKLVVYSCLVLVSV